MVQGQDQDNKMHLLSAEWVEMNINMRSEMTQKALDRANDGVWVELQAGSSLTNSSSLVCLPGAPVIECRQGNQDACVFCSLASALSAIGDKKGAALIAEHASVPEETFFEKTRVTWAHDLLCKRPLKHQPVGRTLFKKKNDVLKVIHHTNTINITQTVDNHCFVVWQMWIFDSNAERALEWNQENLAWCCDVENDVFVMEGGLQLHYCRCSHYKVPKAVIDKLATWMTADHKLF